VSRTEAFGADDETHEVLKSLGYKHSEIHAATSNLPSDMATEDKIRTSLRALSQNHSEQVTERAEQQASQFKPKNQGNARTAPDNPDYWQGRKDEATLSKANKPPKTARTGGGGRQPRQVDPAVAAYRKAKQVQKLARMMKGKRR
jgi:hypothetical protein